MRALIDFPDTKAQAATGQRLQAHFEQPVDVIEAWTLDQVYPAIERVQAHASAGRWCVGGLTYEAAPAFDLHLSTHMPDPAWPMVWFGIFEAPAMAPFTDGPPASNVDWRCDWSRTQYMEQARAAQRAMAAGECYQVNLTTSLQGSLHDEPAAWLRALRQQQPAGYLVWLEGANRQVISASPELFFDWQPSADGGHLRCRPMKGTAAREGDPSLDLDARERLRTSAKERAENVMIVDLLRNDMGRLAQTGTVCVERLLDVEAWPTVWQMTSSIGARTRPGVGLLAILEALFPCGSITGAPKKQAMRHISALETGPRGPYCGALGVVRPGGHATFNVPIRTLSLRRDGNTTWQARYGVGSGLTVYADPAAEWQELMTKSRLLHRAGEAFGLLETLRLEDGRYWLLDHHLQRLADSASHFGYGMDLARAKDALEALSEANPSGLWRVRLQVDRDGAIDVQAFAMIDTTGPVRVALAPAPLNTDGASREFILHKTTRRAHYEVLAPTDPALFDHLLFNERREITEFTRGNVALLLDGKWCTPPLACGLLAGTYRRELLAEGRLHETVVTLGDLESVQGLAFFNGLRGWLDAQLVP